MMHRRRFSLVLWVVIASVAAVCRSAPALRVPWSIFGSPPPPSEPEKSAEPQP